MDLNLLLTRAVSYQLIQNLQF